MPMATLDLFTFLCAQVYYISVCSTRSGGAHARYGLGDWTFMACREHMSTVSAKNSKVKLYREL